MNGTEAILTVKRFTPPRSPALQADALTSEPPGKPIYIKIGPTKKFFAKKKKKVRLHFQIPQIAHVL